METPPTPPPPSGPSSVIHVRLTARELAALDHCRSSEDGKRNRSELVRLLIMREFRRRTTGKSVVADSEVSSEWRVGRPPTPRQNAD